jgi:hypothetical protein
MELLVETHMRSQDRQKGVQQFVDNHAQHFVVWSFIHFICKLLFSWIASWIAFDDFFTDGIFRRPIIAGWGRDMGTIRRPIQISIQICGWRWDRLVDPIKIGSTGSPTLQLKTCVQLVVSQPLEALHQYQTPSLRSSLRWNNNINNSRRIMMSSVK